MKASCIKNLKTPATIDFGGGNILNFVHNPAAFTPRLEMLINKPEDQQTTGDLALFVSIVVVQWDLVADAESVAEIPNAAELNIVADKVWPITQEALCELPIEFLGQLVKRINQDSNPNASSSAPTAGSSSPAARVGSFS